MYFKMKISSLNLYLKLISVARSYGDKILRDQKQSGKLRQKFFSLVRGVGEDTFL